MTLRAAGFLLPLGLPGLVLAGAMGGGAWLVLVPAVVFGALPLIDHLVGVDDWNPAPDEERALADALWYRALLALYGVIHFALIAWAVAHAGAMTGWERLGLALTLGIVTGAIGITVAHELGHKRGVWERVLAWWLLASVAYAHFRIEHNKGHHGRVATPEDPASARLGESFWWFLPRTVGGSFMSAWNIERERLAVLGQGPWHPGNGVLRSVASTALLFALGAAWGGAVALGVLGVQALVAIGLLEAVNYVEHYGLERARHADGGWARVEPCHSWNASHRVTNWYLFNLQRHSHHHIDHARRFQTLRHLPESPQLPTGYSGMVLLALVPPLWRAVMDPRVQRYRQTTPAAAGGSA